MKYLRLETKGRNTGLPHIVALRYALIDQCFFVIPGRSNSDWVLNSLQTPTCTVRVADFLFDVKATNGSEQERKAALEGFKKKYGARFVERWYGNAAGCLRMTPNGPPTKRGSTTGEFDSKSTLEEWRKTGRSYYGEVAAAFDSASEEYDYTIRHNFINTWTRRRSIAILRKYIRPDDTLVEIGCGTGAEALEVSEWVRTLVATDVSQRMIDLVKMKVRAKGLEGKVLPARLAASELQRVHGLLEGRKVHVVYSFNGALNCELRMGDFVDKLYELLEPGGFFVCSIRNTLCLSEMVLHAAVFQFHRATPRKKQPIMVSVGGMDIPSTYYSPRSFLEFFRPRFSTREVVALPGLLPPAYLNDYYLRVRGITSALERLDTILSGRFPVNRTGDQTLFVLQKPVLRSGLGAR